MAFKDRISGMFRFGAKGAKPRESGTGEQSRDESREETRVADPLPATEEEREALLQELSTGFVHVGSMVERLDENLAAGTRSLEAMTATQERLPALLAEQQHLIQEVAETAGASRRALEALGEHLQQRDQAQQAIVERLEALGRNLEEQRNSHREQLELVMRIHRSGRLASGLLLLGGFVLVLLLLGALLYVLLGDRIAPGGQHAAPAAAASAIPAPAAPAEVAPAAGADATAHPYRELMEEAAASADSTVARRARSGLERAAAAPSP